MDRKKNRGKTIVLLALGILAIVIVWLIFTPKHTAVDNFGKKNKIQENVDSQKVLDKKDPGIIQGKIDVMPTIDYKNLEENKTLKKLMETRKENLGVQKSLDMIVKSDESFIIGDSKISMREILEKTFAKNGEVYQEDISPSKGYVPLKIKQFGIHVVQPGENLWNIHFNILKEYYAAKNIQVAAKADEPGDLGFSSGIGKVLKFSETMVIIYDLAEKQIVKNINLLEPLSKIVVYNMDAVFALLEEINYDNVSKIQFDGKNIWISAKKS
ncbi:MAG: hypothetical protein GY710_26155 [Desulfobacteraceae bacterium]|nr:hypothetical protein [Desulfobacteraceae bacterium]